MHIAFLLNGLDVAPAQRAYVEKKVAAVEKMLHNAQRADVDISQDKHGAYRVEVMVHEPGQMYRADEVAQTIEAAVDLVEVKLQEQIRDAHDKRRALQRRGGRSIKKRAVIDDAARF